MMQNSDDEYEIKFSFPGTSRNELRGMQSVRATFKLSERAIGAISIVANQLGIKQKSLFDHLMDDVQTLSAIARELQNMDHKAQQRVQKTYVISRKTLSCLERISKEFNAPRDALIEFSVERLMPIITREREKHKDRKMVLEQVKKHFSAGLALLEKAEKSLGADDPVTDKLAAAMAGFESAIEDMVAFVEKGKLMEDF